MIDKNLIFSKFDRTDVMERTLLTPFVVSRSKKILFFHIGKTGGSTIHHILRKNGLDDGILSDKKGDLFTKRIYFKDVVDHWEEYYKFTSVRNKYGLLVSLWHYDGYSSKISFGDFVEKHVLPSKDTYEYRIDQHYLTASCGECIFDFVVHLETFTRDFGEVCKKLGLDFNPGGKRNVGPYDHKISYPSHYNKRIENMVYSKFKQEIDYFGFNID